MRFIDPIVEIIECVDRSRQGKWGRKTDSSHTTTRLYFLHFADNTPQANESYGRKCTIGQVSRRKRNAFAKFSPTIRQTTIVQVDSF